MQGGAGKIPGKGVLNGAGLSAGEDLDFKSGQTLDQRQALPQMLLGLE